MHARRLIATTLCSLAALTALEGCRSKGEIVMDDSIGISAVRTRCPAVGIPDYTGDITLFGNSGEKIAANLDLVAVMTNVRVVCNENVGDKVQSQISFDVQARRNDTHGARTVTLPYFISVLQGGVAVISKRVGQVTLSFADGQDRAHATGTGTTYVDRAAATLPQDVHNRLTRQRRAGEADAAVDPLTDPKVKSAVSTATFEVLLGFQLTDAQIAYNATR